MDKWIPISEESPKGKEHQYIVTARGKCGKIFTVVAWWERGKWWMMTPDGWLQELHGVEAWMKLPKPYIKGIAE